MLHRKNPHIGKTSHNQSHWAAHKGPNGSYRSALELTAPGSCRCTRGMMGRRSKWKRRTGLRVERAAATTRMQSCALLGRVGATSSSSTGTSATHATSSCKCFYRLLNFIVILMGTCNPGRALPFFDGRAPWFGCSLGWNLPLLSWGPRLSDLHFPYFHVSTAYSLIA